MHSFDSTTFRHVLSHYPTGVCAVTAMDGDTPFGMVVGSFSSASLDPPLVAFFPDKRSTTWPRIETAGRFCVNVLAEHQQHVCATIVSKIGNKFDSMVYRRSNTGMPVIEGSVVWIDCELFAIHDAGDHHLVLGKVHGLGTESAQGPLLFFRGGYGRFAPIGATAG